MNKRPTFNETVDVLVRAYLNDTLKVGDYCACAVGNLMAHAVKAKIIKSPGLDIRWEHDKYMGGEWYQPQEGEEEEAEELIKSTGYSPQEIFKIEAAFESTSHDSSDRMFIGLMRVIDVLAEIHGVDLSVKESAKLQFVKP